MSKKKAIIIGAGISGIATANLLAKAGYSVDVYEKNNQIGGRAGLLKADGFTFDTGPSWYLMPEVFEHYFNLFDLSANTELKISPLKPAYKIFFEKDKPVTITSDLEKDAETFEAIEPGSGKKLKRYVKSSSKIYELSLKHFLYTNFSSISGFLKTEVLFNGPKMLALAATSVDQYVSRYFTDHRLKKVLEYSMVFLGSSPFKTPAIYTLMSALDFKYGVFYPKDGLYSVIKKVKDIGTKLDVKYHMSAPVEKIIVKSGKASGIKLSSGEIVKADLIVSGADLHHTETKLLDRQYQTYPDKYWANKNAGPSALLMYLGVKGELPELEHHSLLFVDKWKENFESIYEKHELPKNASIYMSRATSTDKRLAPEGNEAVVVLVPWPTGVDVDKKTQDKYVDIYLDAIQKMTGIKDFKDRIVSKTVVGPNDFKNNYNSWQSTALGPAHTLKQSAFLRTGNKSKKVSNLYYAGGSTIPGIGLPMCLISAELVYKHIVNDKSGGPIKDIKKVV
jgi:phytoene desaturase